jgi:hypothetical protein
MMRILPRLQKPTGRKGMPDNPMKDDDPIERRESPGQTPPMTQPDKSREGIDKNRQASDEDFQDEDVEKKQVPGSPDRDTNRGE